MSKRVLIVEDVADIRLMMKILIQLQGYEPIVARDGSEAVELAKEYHPGLILMDLMMPVMDGFTAARIIKESEEIGETPIFALTAYGEEWLEKAREIGFDAYLAKPVDFESLKPLLNRYLH